MVDDTDLEGTQQRRRFLIYDAMMLGGEGICDLRFAVSTTPRPPLAHPTKSVSCGLRLWRQSTCLRVVTVIIGLQVGCSYIKHLLSDAQ